MAAKLGFQTAAVANPCPKPLKAAEAAATANIYEFCNRQPLLAVEFYRYCCVAMMMLVLRLRFRITFSPHVDY